MTGTTIATRAAGAVVAVGLTIAAAPAVAPSAAAAPAAVQKTQKTQLQRIKAEARTLAAGKIAAYRTIRGNQRLLATLPAPQATNVRTHARAQETRLARLRTQAGQARTVARAQAVRKSIRAADPAALADATRRASALAVATDPGVLQDLLDTLLAQPVAGTPLAPVVETLNELLNTVLAGSPDTAVVEELLTSLHGLLGGLQLSPDTAVVEQVLTSLHDLLGGLLPRR